MNQDSNDMVAEIHMLCCLLCMNLIKEGINKGKKD